MRKFIHLILTILLCAVGMNAWAYDFEKDGIYYNITSNADPYTVEVTHAGHSNSYSGDVVIPESVINEGICYSVTKIGTNAFISNPALTTVAIPKTVTTIKWSAFAGLEGLNSINVNAENPRYKSLEGVLFNHDMDTLIIFPRGKQGDYLMPNTVEYFGTSFIFCKGLTSITISNSIDTIGYNAFYGCSNLSSVTIPNSVKTIEDQAFHECGIVTLNIPNSVTKIGESAFSECIKLTSIVIPNSVTTIGESAFYGCTNLSSVTLPNTITIIGMRMFVNCTSLTSIEIPNSVTAIDTYSFSNCTGLTSVEIPNSVTTICSEAFTGCTGLTSITIPNSVTTIGGMAFSGCTGLASITLPSSVTSIGVAAFYFCTGLTSINVETGNSRYKSIEGVLFSYDLDSLFMYPCGKQGGYSIPNSVTFINDVAFAGCAGLISVIIPDSVIKIGNRAFKDCINLSSVSIGNSVTNIGGWAFENCENISNFFIPNSVTSIGGNPLYNTSWYNNQPDGILYLDNWYLGYKGEKPTGMFALKQGTKGIADYSFNSCSEITSVYIPNTVKYLSGFCYCSRLNGIIIPNSVTAIGSSAFYGCSNIKTVIALSDTPPTLESSAFGNMGTSKLIVACGNQSAYTNSDWSQYFGNIEEDCNTYNISVINGIQEGGSLTVSKNTALLGEEISINTSTNTDYVMQLLEVCKADDESVVVPVDNNKFIMPNFDVKVKVRFSHTAINENASVMASVYPNPTNGLVTVEAENLQRISVFNLMGQKIMENTASGNSFECDMSRYGAGVYMMQIETANGIATKRIVVK